MVPVPVWKGPGWPAASLPEHGPSAVWSSGMERTSLAVGAEEEGSPGSADSTSEASLLVNGVFDPIQELGDLSVDSWLLATFLAPAYNPVDIVSAVFFTG